MGVAAALFVRGAEDGGTWVGSGPVRHPSESGDLVRQALHHEALGPGLRRSDG
jgi:hypothetical protein